MTAATMWYFEGSFLSGDKDEAGTPIGDICTGYFVTPGADRSNAERLIGDRYATSNPSGHFLLRSLQACPCPTNPNRPAQILKRGGTKKVPVLR